MAGLENGTRFPTLAMPKVGGGDLNLPTVHAGSPAVILAYRGSWCSRCNAQLASFQHSLLEFIEEGIKVIAFSTDDEQHAKVMVETHNLTFPVGYGVDMNKVSALLQGYVNNEHGSLESSNFLVRPDGAIEIAVYSSGPIGRLAPEDVLDIVRRRRERWGTLT